MRLALYVTCLVDLMRPAIGFASLRLLARRLGERAGAAAGSRLRSITASWWGMWLAHLGIGIFIIGVTMVGSLDRHLDVRMKEGQRAELLHAAA